MIKELAESEIPSELFPPRPFTSPEERRRDIKLHKGNSLSRSASHSRVKTTKVNGPKILTLVRKAVVHSSIRMETISE